MPDEKGVAAGKRFARDMRRVREHRGVSLAAIHEQTQIAETLLESFEEGGLYDHPAFNEVYLRSFVRAYASVVDLPPDEAVAGLEAALAGNYQDALAATYLEDGDREAEDQDAGEKATEEAEPPEDEPPTPERAASDRSALSPASADDPEPEPASPPKTSEESPDAQDRSQVPGPAAPPVDADDAPPHPSSIASGTSDAPRRLQSPVLSIGAALLVVGVIGIGAWYVVGTGGSSPVPPEETDPASESTPQSSVRSSSVSSPADTSEDPPAPSPEASSSPTLGDTLHLTLRADSTVSGLRLRRDEDLRRPYWIEEGEAATFPFTTRAILENDLDAVTVYLENRRVTLGPDTADRISLDRQRVGALLENSGHAPAEWTTPPDTIPVGPLAPDSSAT